MGCAGRALFAWLVLAGGLCVTGSWVDGSAPRVLVGLVLLALAALVTGASRPVRLTEARRRPIAEQTIAAAGWSLRRTVAVALSASAILLAPVVSFAAASAMSDAGWIAGDSIVGFLLWLLITSAGVAGLLIARRRRSATWHAVRAGAQARARDPSAEWTWDHPWEPAGARKSFRPYLGTRGMYFGRNCVVAALLLAPVPGDGSVGSAVVSSIRIAFAIAGSIWLLRVWWILGMGHVALGYLKFPVHPGEHAEFTLGVSEGGADIRDAEVVLRHYRESRDGTGPGSGLPLSTAVIAASEPASPSTFLSGVHRKVEFDIPADADVTSISSAHPSYWVLEIRGRTRAGPYEDRLLVPIYARPVAGRVAADPAAPATRA